MPDDNSLSAPKGARIDRLNIKSSGNGMREGNGETQASEVDLVRAGEVWEKLPGGALLRKLAPPKPGPKPDVSMPKPVEVQRLAVCNLLRAALSSLEGNSNADNWAEMITALRASFREYEAVQPDVHEGPKTWAGHRDWGILRLCATKGWRPYRKPCRERRSKSFRKQHQRERSGAIQQ